MNRAVSSGAVVGLIALLAASAASGVVRSGIPAADFAGFAFDQHPGAALPLDAAFRGADGRLVPLGSLFGSEPVLLDFEYDHCTTLCGVMLDQLTGALRTLPLQAGRDYRVVAIDIDPAATPQAAIAFAHSHGADRPGMIVLTADEVAIRRLAEAVGFSYRRDGASGQFAHPAGFVVVTPEGNISRYLLGLAWRPFDLRLALIEAAGERIAAPAEQVLLFCYCYDPQTGQYDLAVARLLEIVGAGSLLALGGIVWLAARKGG